MILLIPALRARLTANAERARIDEDFDPPPVVRFFNPLGAATWLATELYPDGDTLFGLADLGFGTPELGTFNLAELRAVRLPLGLRLERDLLFASDVPLSVWIEAARRCGSIREAETLLARLRRRAPANDDELPPPGG
ncbi:DUF2958 domain-containing protein [Sphingomonas cannabina]|uniref:DUF2958 domain-containing protein n=1 Tax=Sphingomonas cannabina TaxID=2899123 RepID=UPI001F2385E8|nr:DUF2958 domain-containing protein [Sphingomonas cannabina]UIJ44782.1 DUF2958 domain-containing protein [Sphingomonas cannabina]